VSKTEGKIKSPEGERVPAFLRIEREVSEKRGEELKGERENWKINAD